VYDVIRGLGNPTLFQSDTRRLPTRKLPPEP
jgi:hypothetical protein